MREVVNPTLRRKLLIRCSPICNTAIYKTIDVPSQALVVCNDVSPNFKKYMKSNCYPYCSQGTNI